MPEQKLPETIEEYRKFTIQLHDAATMRANLQAIGADDSDELIEHLAGRPVTIDEMADAVTYYSNRHGGPSRDAIYGAVAAPEVLQTVAEVAKRVPQMAAKFNMNFDFRKK